MTWVVSARPRCCRWRPSNAGRPPWVSSAATTVVSFPGGVCGRDACGVSATATRRRRSSRRPVLRAGSPGGLTREAAVAGPAQGALRGSRAVQSISWSLRASRSGSTSSIRWPGIERFGNWRKFSEGYTGVVLELEPGPEFRKAGRPVRELLPALFGRLRGYWGVMLAALLAGLLLVLPGMAIPVFTSIDIDNVLLVRTAAPSPLLAVMALTILMQPGASAAGEDLLRRADAGPDGPAVGRFYGHLLELPLTFYGQRETDEFAHACARRVPAEAPSSPGFSPCCSCMAASASAR